MGEFCCFFMAQGDKAQVHKLIPSVYTAYDIPSSKATQSGPTYVALRANKSDHSTAVSHLADFNRLIDREV